MERKSKKLSIQKMIPNMITLAALSAGMTAIKFAIAAKWEHAVIAIVAAALMDSFDGAAARLLKAQSKLGAELDSFSDFISFGVAPGMVIYMWALEGHGKWAWPVALIFAVSVALRLSRFNIATDENDKNDPMTKYFTGVPSPAGGLLCLFPLVLSFQAEDGIDIPFLQHPWVIGAWVIMVAASMVSPFPTFSTKQIRIPYKMRIVALAVVGVLIAGLINDTWLTLSIVGLVYLVTLPLGTLHYNRKLKSLQNGEKDADEDSDE